MSLLNVATCFGVVATLAALMAPVLVLAAQGQASPCPDQGRSGRPSHCEIREQMLSALGGPLAVDASPNGGITVHGWNRQEIQLRAKVVANADTQQEADALAGQISVLTDGGRIRSDGPRVTGHGGWSVSFDLMVPIDSGLDLQSRNGGISLTDVRGQIELATTNGGITLKNVNGDVRGHTTNGGVKVELSGDGWHGQGLDVQTKNGGAQIVVPDGYSAHLEASTKNGGVRCAFPVTVQGTVGRELSTDLGQGGAPIIIKTINGAVTIARQ